MNDYDRLQLERKNPSSYTGPGEKRTIVCVADNCGTKIKAPKNHPWNIVGWLRYKGWAIGFRGNRFFPACPKHTDIHLPKMRPNVKGYRRPK